MASQSDAAIQDTIAFFADVFSDNCCAFSIAAFVTYDWLVSLSREVQFLWTAKARPLSAILYFSNKYLNLLSQIVNMLENAKQSDQASTSSPLCQMLLKYEPLSPRSKSCSRIVLAQTVITYLTLIPPIVFTGLRAYALTQRRWLSALIFLLSGIPFVTNMVTLRWFDASQVQFAIWGCIEGLPIPPSLARTADVKLIVLILNRVSTIVVDIMLVVITWKLVPANSGSMNARRHEISKMKGLASIMVRNGIIYFIVLSILNVLHLVFTEVSIATDVGTSSISVFTGPLSSLLVSHFLLDLQEAHQRTVVGLATNDPLHISQGVSIRSVQFANALGSLGATIDPGADYHWDEDEDGCLAVSDGIHPSLDEAWPRGEALTGNALVITEVQRKGDGRVAAGV